MSVSGRDEKPQQRKLNTHTHTQKHQAVSECSNTTTALSTGPPTERNFNFIYLIIPVRLKNPQKAAFCSGVPSPASHSKLIFAYEHD